MRRCLRRGSTLASLALLSGLSATASSSANYALQPATLDGGGGLSSSASYRLLSTLSGDPVGSAASASHELRQGFPATATGLARVVGRKLFYNRSAWDAGTAGADPRDDQAIAPDKVALLPGGTAGFQNYSSYSRGLNGIMLDVDGLPGPVSASDFSFRVGNTGSPWEWPAAPVPTSVTTRPGGVGGSTRVTLIWPDGAIVDSWLRIEVRPTLGTDLDGVDRFYFGNAVGETGDRPGVDAIVDAADEQAARENVRSRFSPVPLGSVHDFNRDRQVDATDQILARLHGSDAATALRMLTVPRVEPPAGGGARPMLAGAGVTKPVALVARLDDSGWMWIHPVPGASGLEGLRLEWSRQPVGGPWTVAADAGTSVDGTGTPGWRVRPIGEPTYFRLISPSTDSQAADHP